MATAVKPQSNIKFYVQVGITLAFMFLFRFIPAPAPITPYGMSIVGIFIGLIYGWSICQGVLTWPALIGMAALAFTDYGTASQVMIAAFGNDTVALTIIGMFFIAPVMESGVTEYALTRLCSSKLCAGRPWRLTIFLLLGCTLLGIIMNTMIIAIFMQAIISDFAKQIGYKKGDLYPLMLLSGVFVCMMAVMCIFPFRGYPLMPIGIMKGALGFGIEFGPYMLLVIPSIFVICFGWALIMRLTPGCDASRMAHVDLSALEAKFPNGMTKLHKVVTACLLLFVGGSVFISFVSGDSAFVTLMKKFGVYGWTMFVYGLYMVIRIDGEPLLNMKKAGNYFQWDTIFVILSATLVSGAMTTAETGVAAFVTMLLQPIFTVMGEYAFLVFLTVITLMLTNFMNNMGVTVTMLAVCFSMYSQGILVNIEVAVILVSMMGMCGVMTPAASIYGAMLHSAELSTPKACYINGSITILYLTLIAAIIMVPLGMICF